MFAFILRKVSVHISTLYLNEVMCVSTVFVRIRAMSLGKGHKGRRQNTTAAAPSVPQPVATGCYWWLRQLYLELINYNS